MKRPNWTPSIEIIAAPTLASALVLSSPHSGCHLSCTRFWRCRPPRSRRALRRSEDSFVDELLMRPVDRSSARIRCMRAHFPRCLRRRRTGSPTNSIRACSRGGCPAVREYPIDAGRGGARHGSTRGRRCAGNLRRRRLSRWTTPCARIDGTLQALSPRAAPADDANRIERFRRRGAGGLPFDAVFGSSCHDTGRAIRGPISSSATAHGTSCDPGWWSERWSEATLRGARLFTVSRNKPYAGGFITEHYGQSGRTGLHAVQTRDQPRTVYGRAPVRAVEDVQRSCEGPRVDRRRGCTPSRCRNCGPTGRQRSKVSPAGFGRGMVHSETSTEPSEPSFRPASQPPAHSGYPTGSTHRASVTKSTFCR